MKANPFFLFRRRGFTLIELLVVLAIMTILLSLAGPNLIQSLQGSSLVRAGALVQNNLKMAHQYALSLQNTVQVRFYRIPAVSGTYSALQLIQVVPQFSGTGTVNYTYTPLTQVINLPTPNIMITTTTSTGSLYSSLLNSSVLTTTNPISGTDPSIPVYGLGYDYVQFGFLPNGGTTLTNTTGQLYYVTVAASVKASNPANFFTIQVDPLSGKITTYRP